VEFLTSGFCRGLIPGKENSDFSQLTDHVAFERMKHLHLKTEAFAAPDGYFLVI
jgi:hypothetical protein